MQVIQPPDYYLCLHRAQLKTPIEVLKKNFKNLTKLIEKNNTAVNKQIKRVKLAKNKNERLLEVNKLIKIQGEFNKKLKVRYSQFNDFLERLMFRIGRFDRINRLYDRYYNIPTKEINSGLNQELVDFYREENNLIILNYLLLSNYENDEKMSTLCLNLGKKLHINKLIDFDIINQGLKIKFEILKNKNLKLLKNWCLENQDNLKNVRDNNPRIVNDLKFECSFQQFTQLIIDGNYSSAITFARDQLINDNLDQFMKIDKISCGASMIWRKFMKEKREKDETHNKSNQDSDDDVFSYYQTEDADSEFLDSYNEYISDSKWMELSSYFFTNFKLIYGFNETTQMVKVLSIGGSVLNFKNNCNHEKLNDYGIDKFLTFGSQIQTKSQKFEKYFKNNNCPICSLELESITKNLPSSLVTKSNIFDDPIMLTNHDIFSFKKLLFYNRFNSYFSTKMARPNLENLLLDENACLNVCKFNKHNQLKNNTHYKFLNPFDLKEYNSIDHVYPA